MSEKNSSQIMAGELKTELLGNVLGPCVFLCTGLSEPEERETPAVQGGGRKGGEDTKQDPMLRTGMQHRSANNRAEQDAGLAVQ